MMDALAYILLEYSRKGQAKIEDQISHEHRGLQAQCRSSFPYMVEEFQGLARYMGIA